MKNSILKFIVLSIITTFTFSSCSDYLDKQPDDQLDLESVFENKKNMERWLAYIYRGLPEYYTYDGPDAIADELIPSVGWEAQGFKAIPVAVSLHSPLHGQNSTGHLLLSQTV